jgi:hypothetical protein
MATIILYRAVSIRNGYPDYYSYKIIAKIVCKVNKF